VGHRLIANATNISCNGADVVVFMVTSKLVTQTGSAGFFERTARGVRSDAEGEASVGVGGIGGSTFILATELNRQLALKLQ
jgi:hypothetical protein